MEHSLLEWSIRAMLMAAATGTVAGALRVRAAARLHRAWACTMAAMLLLPVWTIWGVSLVAPVLPAAAVTGAAAPVLRSAGDIDQGIRGSSARVPPEAAASALAAPIPSSRWPLPNWQALLMAVYLAGGAAFLARLIWGAWCALRMLRAAQREEGFLTSPRCAAPVTIGWLRPVLVLPECWRTWSEAKLDAVLLHEREHVRRRDPLVQLLALCNRCVFWFHPLAWWLERKLAALAEDACDGAVLAGGHASEDYARHLIELARAVSETGARIHWSGAAAFSAGNLPRRIRRIMDAQAAAAIPERRPAAAMALCAILLAACLACSLGRQSGPATRRVSMSEQGRRQVVDMLRRRLNAQEEEALLQDAVLGLTPARAKVREAELRKNPIESFGREREVVRYYESIKDWKSLDALTLWYIGQHPDIRQDWGTRPAWDKIWDREGYEPARRLWMEQLNKPGHGPYFYMNAAEYLSGSDNEDAEKMLLEGRRRYPSTALHWEIFLARHYAWALFGPAGQLPAGKVFAFGDLKMSSRPMNDGPYATKVKETLLASKDVELLDRTVEQLQTQIGTQGLAFAQTLNARILSLDPGNRTAHLRRENLRAIAVITRADANLTLSDSDRMVYLAWQLGRLYNAPGREAKANELLALASRNPKDTNYGTAIFLGNLEQGEEAMARGDKQGAARHLAAAAAAPPTDFLRYNGIDMTLARQLTDAGERKAVANFLEQCAAFSKAQPFDWWASEIRKGKNPPIGPSRMNSKLP